MKKKLISIGKKARSIILKMDRRIGFISRGYGLAYTSGFEKIYAEFGSCSNGACDEEYESLNSSQWSGWKMEM